MNWKLIFSLSLFGMAMGIATVFFIPSNIEPFCWLAIFLVCSYLIAKTCSSKFFMHGLLVSMVNSVWITAAHVILFDQYIASHASEMQMMANGPMASLSAKTAMLIMGPIIGIISGLVLGLFSVIAAKMMKK